MQTLRQRVGWISRWQVVIAAAAFLSACGGGGGGSGGGGSPVASSYTVGGTVSGLTGAGLVLRNNGAGDLGVAAAATSFAFGTAVATGTAYVVTVATQPANQQCSVANGSGSVGGANVVSVVVTCMNTSSVGGTVSGLTGSGLLLRNNGGDDLSVAANATTLAFATRLLGGAAYAVTVATQPSNPAQVCSVANGSGSVGAANVTNVAVTCVNAYTVGGTISGLLGAGLILRNNGGNDLAVTAGAPTFTFSAPVGTGATYAASVAAQPANQTCRVVNGNGTMGTGNVTSLAVVCDAAFSLDTLTDPLRLQQWHLRNTGQNGYADTAGTSGFDLNVNGAYALGNSGAGVIVGVVDSGLEIAHEDLTANVVANGSWNFVNSSVDPTSTAVDGDHGTSVAGIIGAARNAVGGIGVAPAARLKGFNYLASQGLSNYLKSLGGSNAQPNSSDVAIFNESLGSTPTNDTIVDPNIETQYLAGVINLRGGLGAVYLQSAGNAFLSVGSTAVCGTTSAPPALGCWNSNFQPSRVLPFKIVVGALNADGVKSSYASTSSAIWVTAPGGEYGMNAVVAGSGGAAAFYKPAIITTDQSGCTIGAARTANLSSGTVLPQSSFNSGVAPNTACNYTNQMNGTSSAAPNAAGTAALILAANPQLNWREVKDILARTARPVDLNRAAVSLALSNGSYVAEPAWTTNAAGLRFHNWYGFGLIDATAAVNMARTYTLGQLGTYRNTGFIASAALTLPIPDNSNVGASSTLAVPTGTATVVEAVQIRVSATHTYTGDLSIELTSPSGTRSVLKNGRDAFRGDADLANMVLLSNAYYGENAVGTWTLRVVDTATGDTGTLTAWAIRIYGH